VVSTKRYRLAENDFEMLLERLVDPTAYLDSCLKTSKATVANLRDKLSKLRTRKQELELELEASQKV
jgi:hypothetical protein